MRVIHMTVWALDDALLLFPCLALHADFSAAGKRLPSALRVQLQGKVVKTVQVILVPLLQTTQGNNYVVGFEKFMCNYFRSMCNII